MQSKMVFRHSIKSIYAPPRLSQFPLSVAFDFSLSILCLAFQVSVVVGKLGLCCCVVGSGMSHATTASPKPSFMVSCRVGDAVVGRGNAGLATLKSGHFCLYQNCSQRPLAENTGTGSLLNHPSCSPRWLESYN